MRYIAMGWMLAVLSVTTGAQAREFTDVKGRKIEAEIDSVRPPNVVLKRDGKNFLFPVAKLSPADQEFVRKWAIDNPDIKLEFRYTKQKVSSSGSSKDRTQDWRFAVTILNRGLTDISDLKVDYAIFKQVHDRYAESGPTKRLSGKVEGSKEIVAIESQREFVLETKPIRTRKVNKVETSGTLTVYERWNESLIGIQLRVSRGGKVISEDTYGVVPSD